jgi:hypothetical protein
MFSGALTAMTTMQKQKPRNTAERSKVLIESTVAATMKPMLESLVPFLTLLTKSIDR